MHIGSLIEKHTAPFVSLEFFPPSDEATLPAFYDVVEKLKAINPLFVSVTYGAGGKKQDRTLDVTKKLVEMHLPTMAHLTCVGASHERIERFLGSLESIGVHTVLALRGDAPTTDWVPENSSFQHANDLVRFIKTRKPDMGVGVACYPTPHPESPSYAFDRAHTAEKLVEADFGITQLFFDVREYVALVEALRALNITKPIIPGILPVQSFASLRRILSLSGAAISGKLYLQLEEADAKGGADYVRAAGLTFAESMVRRLLDAGAPGVHLYTLNKADMCLALIDRLSLH
ncbi:MAG: methylenetetrahydrofolate reductase [Desulfovibrio sp.]|nr:methylenetetrahydrofolate reductase [Desulfovibrio sp.]